MCWIYLHIYVNGRVSPVDILLGMGRDGDKGE
jgi:hypothetical protein